MAVIPKSYPVAGAVPDRESIAEGELALNTADGFLYTKLRDGRIVQVIARSSSETASALFAVAIGADDAGSTTVALSSHASTHYSGGSDPLSPASIGAASASHTHAISGVTNLQTELDGKASLSHTHAISDVSGLQADLDSRVSSTTFNHIVQLTQAQYNNLSPPQSDTLYVIV